MGNLTNSWSFIFGDSNWKFCKVGYPVGTQKPDIQMWTFLAWDLKKKKKKCFYFWVKKSKPVGYTRTLFTSWGKYEVSWNFCLVFIIDFWSCIPGSFDTVTSLRMGFHSERAAVGLGPSGLIFASTATTTNTLNTQVGNACAVAAACISSLWQHVSALSKPLATRIGTF